MASSSTTPVSAALLLSLFAAIALSSSPAAAYPPPGANTSIAEPPSFSAAPAPAPAPEQSTRLFAIQAPDTAPIDEQEMDSRYLTAHMSAASSKVEAFLAEEVEGRLRDPATAEAERECLAICKEVYESAAESMKSGVESVGASDFVKANFDVSAFNTDIDTCSDCGGGGAGFEKFDRWAKGVAGDCLDRIVKHTN